MLDHLQVLWFKNVNNNSGVRTSKHVIIMAELSLVVATLQITAHRQSQPDIASGRAKTSEN